MDRALAKNRAWAAQRIAEDPDYFNRLVSVQTPRYLWIGCSDSRVPANVILGLEPGEIFVHRNVANLVHPNDLNCLTVLQYAVEVLKVQQIIVCGHYGCGGVKAALQGTQTGFLPYWLRPLREASERARAELDALPHDEARQNRLCELNVRMQVATLAATPILQHAWTTGADVAVHGLVYSLHDGLLQDLNCSVTG